MALGLTAVIYYAVALAALAVGLYGLLSLFWLASSTVERSAYLVSSLL